MSQDHQLNLSRWLDLQGLDGLGADLPPLRVSLKRNRGRFLTLRGTVGLCLVFILIGGGGAVFLHDPTASINNKMEGQKKVVKLQPQTPASSPSMSGPSTTPIVSLEKPPAAPVFPVEAAKTITTHNKPIVITGPLPRVKPQISIREAPEPRAHNTEGSSSPTNITTSPRNFQLSQPQPLVISVKKTGGNRREEATE